jgi:hypothetical protein
MPRNVEEGKRCLVEITADGFHVQPWFKANEKATDGEEAAAAQDPPDDGWELRWKLSLPAGYRMRSVSGDWIALTAPGRLPWLAKLKTPTVVAAELPDDDSRIWIWANGRVIHVFSRSGWRYEEGPLKYRVYDFGRDKPRVINERPLPWARRAEEMDPQAELVVLQSNHRSWARTWLLDLKTDKRKFLRVWPSIVDFVFVKKEVAQQWIKLTRP